MNCRGRYLSCGETAAANNHVWVQSQGNPTGDVNFLFLAFQTHRIVVDTCGPAAPGHIHTRAFVYDKCPARGGRVIGNQSATFEPCSVLTYDVHKTGSYWIVIEVINFFI